MSEVIRNDHRASSIHFALHPPAPLFTSLSVFLHPHSFSIPKISLYIVPDVLLTESYFPWETVCPTKARHVLINKLIALPSSPSSHTYRMPLSLYFPLSSPLFIPFILRSCPFNETGRDFRKHDTVSSNWILSPHACVCVLNFFLSLSLTLFYIHYLLSSIVRTCTSFHSYVISI